MRGITKLWFLTDLLQHFKKEHTELDWRVDMLAEGRDLLQALCKLELNPNMKSSDPGEIPSHLPRPPPQQYICDECGKTERDNSPSHQTRSPRPQLPPRHTRHLHRLPHLRHVRRLSNGDSAILSTFDPTNLRKHCYEVGEFHPRYQKWYTNTQESQLQRIVN